MSRKKNEFHLNAKIRIVKPSFFLRCGYPLSFKQETRRIVRENSQEITKFMASMGVKIDLGFELNQSRSKTVDEIASALAYKLCKQNKFGGNGRKIHTIDIPDAAGMITTISSVQFVRTGLYIPACPSNNQWDVSNEYEPPYLQGCKSHRILGTYMSPDLFDIDLDCLEYNDNHILKIEAANVELVKPDFES